VADFFLHFYRKHTVLIRNLIVLTLLSIITSHLTDHELFSPNSSYNFPWESTLISITLGILISLIAHQNFKYYTKHYFSKSVSTNLIITYVLSTLEIISITYFAVYCFLIWLTNNNFELYFFLIGLLVTLLMCVIAMFLMYGEKIYKLHKSNSSNLSVTIQKNGKTVKIAYNEIAYFFSEEKVVYAMKITGESIATDFTLQELEAKLTQNVFFRANRQFIVHLSSIDEVTTIENGKLQVMLQPKISAFDHSQLIVSRYKKQEFLNWFNPTEKS
jgi:hypothetical protein